MTNKETANADLEYLLLRVPTSFSHGKKQDEGPWLIPQGTKAVDAAEVIHADMKKVFLFSTVLAGVFLKKGHCPPSSSY
jgi:ribosome-binding ATPase YchF (GTP1/OBG family)